MAEGLDEGDDVFSLRTPELKVSCVTVSEIMPVALAGESDQL